MVEWMSAHSELVCAFLGVLLGAGIVLLGAKRK